MEIGYWKVKGVQNLLDIYDSMYSKEEYQSLIDLIPDNSFWLKKGLKQFFKNGYIYTKKFQKAFVYRKLSRYLNSYSPEAFEIMFITPFNKLPLYVNVKQYSCQLVLRWRLTLGK